MRILIAHSFYRIAGGEDGYVRQQYELLRRHHVVGLLARDNKRLHPGLRTAAHMVFSKDELRAVESAIEDFQPDVIHMHNPYPALGPAVHIAADRSQIPLIMTVHNLRLRCPNGLMFTEGRRCERCAAGNYVNAVLHNCFPSSSQAAGYAVALWMHRFVLRLEEKVALFIAPSEFLARRLREWGVPPAKIGVMRNFVTPSPDASPSPGRIGLYVGRLSGEKGLEVLLKALVAAGDPPFQFVGDGPSGDRLVRLAAQFGLNRTRFLGRITPQSVRRMLPSARFVVCPSLCEENAPLAVLEAMAAGRPVLVSRRGGLPELVSAGGGLVCDPDDVRDIASKIQALAEDDGLCATLGAHALTTTSESLSPQGHLASLQSAYARVLAASKRAS